MKYLSTLIIALLCINTFSQNKRLVDYFYSVSHTQKEYKWKVGIKEFELSQVDNQLIVCVSKKVLTNGVSITETNYYHPFNNEIINTQRKNSFTNRYNEVDKILIKHPNSIWKKQTDGGYQHYSTQLTSIETDYKKYEDCIAVKKWFVATDTYLKGKFDVYYTVSYFAYKVGLVKVETYNTSTQQRADEKNRTLDKQLID